MAFTEKMIYIILKGGYSGNLRFVAFFKGQSVIFSAIFWGSPVHGLHLKTKIAKENDEPHLTPHQQQVKNQEKEGEPKILMYKSINKEVVQKQNGILFVCLAWLEIRQPFFNKSCRLTCLHCSCLSSKVP